MEKVYITKYALTSGIFLGDWDGTKTKTGGIWVNRDLFYGDEFANTLEEAVEIFEKMKAKKIKALENQLNKFKNMEKPKFVEK